MNCFLTQYSLIFLSIILLANLSCCVGTILSLVGQLFVVSSISWFLTKKFRETRNNDPVTSFQRAVLITGCDTGFGNALAHKLNENGFRVYATVLDPESDGAKDLVTGARFESKTQVMKMNVTDDEEIKTVYEQIKSDLELNGEKLWAVVNNAGIATLGPLDWGTIETYKDILNVNTLGTARVTRTFLPLIRQSKGRIVNLVSMAGRHTAINMGVYSMSKHATIAFSDALRRENRNHGINVSTVEPIAYKTPMTSNEYFNRVFDQQWNQSSDDVKEFYGEEFFQHMKASLQKGAMVFPPGENIYEVVDKLVEAVQSSEPQLRYPVSPAQFMPWLFITFASWLPAELFEKLITFCN